MMFDCVGVGDMGGGVNCDGLGSLVNEFIVVLALGTGITFSSPYCDSSSQVHNKASIPEKISMLASVD